MKTNPSSAVGATFVALLLFGTYACSRDDIVYTQTQVSRGPIESVVIATGTLEALNTVIVGSELSGQIAALHADFNQPVRQGDLLAQIDPRTFEARVQQARADMAVAAATLAQRRAELTSARVTLAQAEREYDRRQALRERGHVSQSELDADLTRVDVGRAGIEIAEAAVENAEALLTQRRSALAQAELDLERTEIRAPITGTVVNRTIQRGQTVAASLQAPELFQIAEDLHRMKVEASIDEADIGLVAEGMPSRFTVDAFPDRRFDGTVSQVRIAPDRLLNVVTYRVIITTPNDDLALLPGMTANVEIVLGARDDVLRVPNAALRYEPREARSDGSDGGTDPTGASAPGPRVWVLQAGEPVARPVRTGLAGDLMTEILEGLAEGEQVIVGASRPQPQ